jgi:hypothetical protein
MYPVELDGARIEDGNAEIYLRFDVQEVKVLVDKKGELKQGTYDDLMKTAYGMCSVQMRVVICSVALWSLVSSFFRRSFFSKR